MFMLRMNFFYDSLMGWTIFIRIFHFQFNLDMNKAYFYIGSFILGQTMLHSPSISIPQQEDLCT